MNELRLSILLFISIIIFVNTIYTRSIIGRSEDLKNQSIHTSSVINALTQEQITKDSFEINFALKNPESEDIHPQKALSKLLLAHYKKNNDDQIRQDIETLNPEGIKKTETIKIGSKLKIKIDNPDILLGGMSPRNKSQQIRDDFSDVENSIESVNPCNDVLTKLIDGPTKQLGNGAFGRVLKPDLQDSDVVIKEMEVGLQKEKLILNEILISLMFPNSDHVAKYYTACYIDRMFEEKDLSSSLKIETKRFYYLFMEQCDGDFDDWFFSKVEDKDVLMVERIIHQISMGYQELHSKNILHVDNHIGNYMICDNKIKIIDFGVSVYRPNLKGIKLKVQEDLEFNELYNFFNTLLHYKSIKDKQLLDIIQQLRRARGRSSFNDINEFIINLEGLFKDTRNLIAQGKYIENSSTLFWNIGSWLFFICLFLNKF